MSDGSGPTRAAPDAAATTRVSASAALRVFDLDVTPRAVFETVNGTEKRLIFSVGVGDRTLGDVLRYILGKAGGDPDKDLGEPWNVLDSISLKGLSFQFETSTNGQRYGFSYSDIGLDLTFLQIDKLEIWYRPVVVGPPKAAASVDVNVYGTFLGVSFEKDPISWDALREQPPSTPAAGPQKFRLDYLGLGQHVTLRDVRRLDTIAKVMDALAGSYKALGANVVDPLATLGDLTYDEGAAWLVGTKFSAMDTFDLSAIWNLPALAGLRVALRGERAKSLAGLEFEILYRRIADDLGLYHIELVLPDVLRKFQAGIASVTLPVIVVDVYTDGGFLVDLGFPHGLDFSRAAQLEMIIMGVPVLGSLGVYFGVLSAKAVPDLPKITGGNFGPVIVAGVGARIGVGKSLQAGLLSGEVFIGIEGTLEGMVAFYEAEHPDDPKGTFYRVDGTLQLTGHIWGQVSFAIIKARLDVYAYVSARAVLEAYRATLLVFSAGVSLKLTVTVGIGWFSFDVKLSFSASITERITIGSDTAPPWRLAGAGSATLTERLTRGAYRRLPTGIVHADETYARLLAAPAMPRRPARARREGDDRTTVTLYFHPIASVGVQDDHPRSGTPDLDLAAGEVTLVASMVTSLTRPATGLSSGEAFVRSALLWGLEELRDGLRLQGGPQEPDVVTLSELHFLADDLASPDPKFPIRKADLTRFLTEWIELDFVPLTQSTPCFEATPFPIVPLYVLTAAAQGVIQHRADLAADPVCSVAYQRFVSRYFDETFQGNGDHREAEDARRLAEGEDLSMAWLIFMDSFRLVLRAIVRSAIDALTLFRVTATAEQSLLDITAACGLPPKALRDVAEANVTNAALWAAGTTIRMVEQGVVTGAADDLSALAGAFDLPLLDTARHVRTQPVLRAGATVRVVGGRYRLKPDDTPDSIQATLWPLTWPAIQAANPFFDWSVPEPAEGYRTLTVPGGSTIELPAVAYPVSDDDTLQSIADRFGAPLYGLLHQGDPRDPAADDQGILLQPDCTAWRCVTFYVLEAESLGALLTRIGLAATEAGQRALFETIAHDTRLLRVGATIAISGGSYVIARGDDLDWIAERLQTTVDAIEKANAGTPQVFIPRPFSDASLPMGETLVIPDVAYVVQTGDSFASIAHAFTVDAFSLFAGPAVQGDTGLLRPLAAVIAPPIPVVIAPAQDGAAPTPEALATPYGVRPADLVLANQRSPAGQGSDIRFGVVAVPQCERVATDDLLTGLAAQTESSPSAFGAALHGLARFLLAGLRLPDPASVPAEPSPGDPLYPLYTLTGQQWPAPAQRSDDYVVSLTPATDPDSQRLSRTLVSAATLEDDGGLTTTLDVFDWDLIDAFRTVLADGKPILVPPISSIAYPALQQVPREMALGAPIEWSVPVPPVFDEHAASAGSAAGESLVLLLPVPDPLRQWLPGADADRDVGLSILEAVPDPTTGQAAWRALTNVGFAVRLEIRVRPAYETGSDETPIPAVYELVSAAARTQAELTALLGYLRAHADTVAPEIHVLFAPSATTHLAGSLQSDALSAEDRARVAILKSNLSTFSRPPRVGAALAGEGPVTAATLDEPISFIQLLWELSVTNSGGFYLDYGAPADHPGLPDDVFAESESVVLTFLVIVREKDGPATIAPRAFHDTLICAQNLSAPSATVVATPVRYPVKAGAGGTLAEPLDAVATAVGLTATEVAELNQSTPNILQAGFPVPGGANHDPYQVRPGDDLLSVAATLATTVADVATRIAPTPGALRVGALLEIEPDWVVPRNRVAQRLGGFRVLRAVPPPVAGDRCAAYAAADGPASLDGRARLERMFNLLGYGLDDSTAFKASTRGLPVPPADPDETRPNGLFAVAAGDDQPWLYDRLMPIAAWAKQDMALGPDAVDPYARLGASAAIALRFQDVFGNLLPDPGAAITVPWPQAYRDPIVPPSLWPSVTMSYDVQHIVTHDTPELDVRIKFAPAGYVVEPGTTVARLRRKARSDRAEFATAFYQTADERMAATLHCTLVPDERRQVSTTALNGFAGDCHAYLRVIERLRPLWHRVDDVRDLGRLAGAYQVTAAELALTAADADDVLEPGAPYEVPVFQLVLPNTSIRAIIEAFEAATGQTLTAGEIARQNPSVGLTEGVDALLGEDRTVTVGPDATLLSVATDNGLGVERLAELNQALKRFLRQGDILLLATRAENVPESATIADLARAANLTVPDFAAWTADAAILRADARLEIPRHVIIPEALAAEAPGTVVRVGHAESIAALTARVGLETAIRDVATANADAAGLLVVGAVIVYPDGDTLESVAVLDQDTLATIVARLSRALDLPDLKPADVCSYPDNAGNPGLLREGALALVPPRRLVIPWNLVLDERLEAGIVELRVDLTLERTDPAAIDPHFADAPGVGAVTVEVPPRLSSAHTREARESLRAFADQFHAVFPNLYLATGPAVLPPGELGAEAAATADPTKLLAVQWQKGWRDFEIHQAPVFFAPTPLITELWHERDVVIYEYQSGEPLPPVPPPDSPPLQDFANVDLERWAEAFLGRVDTLLEPLMGSALRALAPAQFERLTLVKATIAGAIAGRVEQVLDQVPAYPPDRSRARKTFEQQLLVALLPAYQGGTVLQFPATVYAPADWVKDTAPAVYGHARLIPSLELPDAASDATLDWIADHFDAPPIVVAEVLQAEPNILDAGSTITLPGKAPTTICKQDTLLTLCGRLGATLEALVDAYDDRAGLLKPGAPIGIVVKHHLAEADDTFLTVVDQLALDVVAKTDLATAIRRFALVNDRLTGVFLPDIALSHQGVPYRTTGREDIRTAAGALGMTSADFVYEFRGLFPLLREHLAPLAGAGPVPLAPAPFRFLTLYPPSTLSDAKLELYAAAANEPPSSLNVMYVTSSPDDAGSVKLRLGFESTEMEYRRRKPFADLEYQSSEWLTFVGSRRRADLGDVVIPIVNRRFPIPPAILSHDTVPVVGEDWTTQPPLAELPGYGYALSFAFHPAAQDELGFEAEYYETPVIGAAVAAPGGGRPEGVAPETLATQLAQFQAIDKKLWADLLALRSRDAEAGSDRVLRNAIDVFVGLAERIANLWGSWTPPQPARAERQRFRIRTHGRRGEALGVTMCPVGRAPMGRVNGGRPTPRARLLGPRVAASGGRGDVTWTSHAAAGPAPLPLDNPYRYEVFQAGLSALREQSALGLISVTRNGDLVSGVATNDAFVLHIRDVRPDQPAVPRLLQTRELDVGTLTGLSLTKRIARFLTDLLFPDLPDGTQRAQLVSVGMAYARPLFEGGLDPVAGSPAPADTRTIFVPIAITPAESLALLDAAHTQPEAIAQAVATRLETWRKAADVPATVQWALTLRLFGTDPGLESQTPLLELVDLRIPNATQ